MSTFCINNCLTPPWFSPSQHVFPTSPTLGQVASPFVRSLCSQEVNIIEDIFYPRHLDMPNLLEFRIDITFKFYGLALMRSKLNLSCISRATSTRSTSTLLESSISWWRPPSKISIQQWNCPFATQELWEQLKSPSFEVRTILKGTRAKESSKLKVVWRSYWRCHVQEGWKLKQDALKESKKQNWKIARKYTLENIENWQEEKLKDANNS